MYSNLRAALLTLTVVSGCNALLAQGPVTDTIIVTFDQPVMVGDRELAAGEYTIRQLSSESNPRILEFSSKDGTKVATSASTIPMINNNNVHDTQVDLEMRGAHRYVKNIWVAGKTYGYGFAP